MSDVKEWMMCVPLIVFNICLWALQSIEFNCDFNGWSFWTKISDMKNLRLCLNWKLHIDSENSAIVLGYLSLHQLQVTEKIFYWLKSWPFIQFLSALPHAPWGAIVQTVVQNSCTTSPNLFSALICLTNILLILQICHAGPMMVMRRSHYPCMYFPNSRVFLIAHPSTTTNLLVVN